jgi:predicted O-methyltransferase YrrM
MRSRRNGQRARLSDYLNAARHVAREAPRRELLNGRGLLNAARFAATHPRGALVMGRQVLAHGMDHTDHHELADIRAWLAANAQDPATVAHAIAPDLWSEATEFSEELHARATPILDTFPYQLHPGPDDRFLYWLTRVSQPDIIVETGVCAGWSSQAFLAALERNGHGALYSSDFPLFYRSDPESLIGCLVEDDLRDRWHLCISGDEVCLPRVLAHVPKIDLFHYDSTQSRSGRNFTFHLVQPKLARDSVVIINGPLDRSCLGAGAAGRPSETTILNKVRPGLRHSAYYAVIGPIRLT